MKLKQRSLYPNLDAELIRNRVTWEDLSTKIRLPLQLLTYRMVGIIDFTVNEAQKVKKALGSELPLEKLFETEGS